MFIECLLCVLGIVLKFLICIFPYNPPNCMKEAVLLFTFYR